jgi:hypothetical protein
MGKTVSFGCALSFALSAFGTMAPLSAGRRAEAVCDTVCFDFSRLTLMNQYHVGDSVRAGDATVYLESYLKNGNLISLAAATAYANQSLHSKECRRSSGRTSSPIGWCRTFRCSR